MVEYIDRQAVLDELDEDIEEFVECDYALKTAKKYIKKIPPADVRPVVLCKDCRYSRKPDRHSMAENAAVEGVLICFVGYDHVYPSISNDVFVDGEHFCGYGEVRDG